MLSGPRLNFVEQEVLGPEHSKLFGGDNGRTLREAVNYAAVLVHLQRFKEAKSLLRKTLPVARRVSGKGDLATLTMSANYAWALYSDPGATLDDLCEAVTMFEGTERIGQRVFGGAHPLVTGLEPHLRRSRAALRARETPPPPGSA